MPEIIYIEKTDSTSTYLKTLSHCRNLDEGTVVTTNFQTLGRGQQGSIWESTEGENLLFSIIFYPKMVEIGSQFIISQAISLAIQKILSNYTDDIQIKWPNDIYQKESKICGILIENILSEKIIEQSIVGIGININQTIFLSNAPNPISLKKITQNNYDLKTLLREFIDEISIYYQRIKDGDFDLIRTEYVESLYRKEGYFWYNDGIENFEARIKRIENNGIIVLETKNYIERRFMFKEVKFI